MSSLDKYTRSQLVVIRKKAEEKRDQLYKYNSEHSEAIEVVQNALRKEAEVVSKVVDMIEDRLEALKSSCIFCKNTIETEVPTLTHICNDCDRRMWGGKG